MPQIQEQILEVAENTPQRRIPERIVEHTRDVFVPQICEQIVEVVRNMPQERISELWSLLAMEEEDDLEVVKVIPVEAGSERFVAQDADVPVPPVVAEVDIIPEEHISKRTQIVDIPVPLDRPGDQACRLPADTVHRQGYCRRAYCDTGTGSVEIPQTQYTDKVVAELIATQRQIPQSQTVRKTVEAPLAQFIGHSADVPLISQINQVTKHADISQTQYINHAAAVPVVIQ